jgi:hypothetical protein
MNLTEEQVEAAAKAMVDTPQSYGTIPWGKLDACSREAFRSYARAAAPFLQAPWEMPTSQEETDCFNAGEKWERGMCGVFRHVSGTLREFVLRRNASIIPKAVNSRQEKLMQISRVEVKVVFEDGSDDHTIVLDDSVSLNLSCGIREAPSLRPFRSKEFERDGNVSIVIKGKRSKPVDLRREKVIDSLDAGLPRYQSWDRNAAELLADRILAALDAKE